MTVKDMITEIERLPLDERLMLLEALTHSIRAALQATGVERVRGMLQPEGEIPSDEALKDAYTDYLDEKYR